MRVNKTLVKHLLDTLYHNISIIETKEFPLEEILEDEDVQAILDRRMQLAIESCIDIAAHITAGMGFRKAESASDIFVELGWKAIISKELSANMSDAAKFRNILVHDYTKIDYTLAYSDLDGKLRDLKNFGKEVLEFIDKN